METIAGSLLPAQRQTPVFSVNRHFPAICLVTVQVRTHAFASAS
jgi:hypothetical protein